MTIDPENADPFSPAVRLEERLRHSGDAAHAKNQIPALAYLLIHMPRSDGSLDKRDRTIAACHIAGF